MLRKAYGSPNERMLMARFWRSAGRFWRGPTAWRAWLLTGLLVATVLTQLFVQYRINFWNRDFFDAIERKNGAELWMLARAFVPLAFASLALAVLSVWGRMTTQRSWRAHFTNFLYNHWLDKDHQKKLRFLPGEHQNPEFRIAEDARIATDLPVDLVLGFLLACLTAITFVGVLWKVGGGLDINLFGHNLAIPGYLVIAVVLYSVIITGAMMLVARHLTGVDQRQLQHARGMGIFCKPRCLACLGFGRT